MTVRKRFFTIVKIVTQIVFDFRKESILIKKHGYSRAQELVKSRHEKRATMLYNAAIEMQGALIKLCQFLSTRVDILPESYIKILKPLQDNVPPVDFTRIKEVLKNEYEDYQSLFKEIDEHPLASASLAQVHKAVLNTGETIVLKILKPDIELIIDTDFAILFHIFKLLSHFKFFKMNREIDKILNDFIQVTGDELNFSREAYIANQFREQFADNKNIYIPKIYMEFSTRRILAMEYIHGHKISAVEQWKQRNNDPTQIVRIILEFYAIQLLHTGYIHFDPHPGNILIMNDNIVGIIDFGMSGIISEEMRDGFLDFMKAFYNKDSRAAIEAADNLGFFSENFNKYSLKPLFDFFFREVYSVIETMKLDRESIQSTIRDIDFKKILNKLTEIIYTQPITFPTNWVYIGKTMGSIVGLVSSIDPELNILKEIKPYIDKYSVNNIEFILKKIYKTATSDIKTLVKLPDRIDDFIYQIESGTINLKVDYSEVLNKLDEFKIFIVRVISMLIFSISVICSFIFFRFQNITYMIISLIVILISMIVPFLYKRKISKYNIANKIEKII